MKIRAGTLKDLPRIIEISNFYILHSYATFDTAVQLPEDRLSWFSQFSDCGPHQFIVAEIDNLVQGYAYSSKYRDHPAFKHTVEVSIYIDTNFTAKGIASKLYTKLFSLLLSEELHLAVAGIALPNAASIALHRKFGFEDVGIFKEYAFKNGKYISSLWMQKQISNLL